MPKLSVSVSDQHYLLIQKEMQELGVGASKAIQSLIEKGSPYEFQVEVTFTRKGE